LSRSGGFARATLGGSGSTESALGDLQMDRAEVLTSIDVGEGYGADARISDPLTCGEDLLANLDHLAAFAEKYCVNCGGYHAWHGLDRIIRTKTGIDNDRPDLIGTLQTMIASIAATKKTDPIELLIPGSADTGILSTCAHAAWSLGEETASRLRYTVLDLCETPLSLCRIYERRYGLMVRTMRADFMEPLPHVAADIVVLHSILSYVSTARHVGFLQELGGMLESSGRMILSNRTGNKLGGKRDPKDFGLLLQAALDNGRLKPSVPVDRIMSKTKGTGTVMHEFADDEEMLALIAQTGLKIESKATVAKLRERPAEAQQQYTVRFVAVLHT
jgi:hypothetical protein